MESCLNRHRGNTLSSATLCDPWYPEMLVDLSMQREHLHSQCQVANRLHTYAPGNPLMV